LAQSDTFGQTQTTHIVGYRSATLAPQLRISTRHASYTALPWPLHNAFFSPLYCLVHISRPDMLILCKQRSPPRNVISSTWIGQNGPRLWIEGAKLAKEGAERRIDPRNILGRISEVIPSPSFRGCTYSRGVCGAPTANVCVRVCVCVCVCV
jgi:hypothetical protein